MKKILAGAVALTLAFGGAVVNDESGGAASSPPGRKPNHLINEKSPYLLQHAYNPVDWYPWGEEAFKKASAEDKPILVSIGYSTCHWCHVMERESFSDPRIAEVMNKHLVSIKVDREERPDVDKIYMTAVNAMTGSGGWPLNIFLTPDLKPIFGGTYFPPDPRWGRAPWPDIVERIGQAWKDPLLRGEMLESAGRVSEAIQKYLSVEAGAAKLGLSLLKAAFEAYQAGFDPRWGGFGGAPKFPIPVVHNFLLRYQALGEAAPGGGKSAQKALEMSVKTLRAMSEGGIYDHIGGGFHRYSTDERWHVPHFEKMLYDNAQLAVNYLEAYQIRKEDGLARTARETLDYVLRDMALPQGAFASAEDADSLPPELAGKVEDIGHEHRKEGAFYLWEKTEVTNLLGEVAGEIFCSSYGVEAQGNAPEDPHGEFRNKNIPFLAQSVEAASKRFSRPRGETEGILQESRAKLFQARSKRPRPHRDDKVITAWNGLMISALAKGHQILEDEKYLKAAERAAAFLRDKLYDPRQRTLYRRWRAGEREVSGFADDYAFLAQGLTDLYEASFDTGHLEWAIELTEEMLQRFYDPERGGFYMTSPDHDKNLLVRVKESADNVEPSAGSVAVLNLLKLAQFTDREDFRKAADETLRFFGTQMEGQPTSLPQMLVALAFSEAKPSQIVIAGDPQAPDTREMIRQVHYRFLPYKILILVDGGKSQEDLSKRLSFLRGVTRMEGRATAYVCVNYTCELPTNNIAVLGKILDGKRP